MAPEPSAAPITVHASVLTSEAFAPFGEVIEHSGAQRRRHLALPFDHDGPAVRPAMWVSRVDQAVTLPYQFDLLERHAHSAQTFIPLTGAAYLVVVAPSSADGAPDLARLRAFVASGAQGVCYRRGIWHHGLSVLQAPAQFAVTMTLTPDAHDDEFLSLATSVRIVRAADPALPESRA